MSHNKGGLTALPLAAALVLAPCLAMPALANDFTGLHAGVILGFETGTADIDGAGIPVDGMIAGLEVGATYQFDNGWVIGVTADVGPSYASGDVLVGNYITYTGRGEMVAHLTGRVGYAVGSVLPYVMGGVGYARNTASMSCPAGAGGGLCMATGAFEISVDDARFGYVVGAGLEVALAEHVSLKAEYLYADYGTAPMTLDVPVAGLTTTEVAIASSTIRTGLNFRF